MRCFKFFLVLLFSVNVCATSLDKLLPDERNTVEIFQKTAPKVVFVHRLATVVNQSYEKFHVSAGAGSGIIWDKEGHIITNFHVIKDADDLAVSLGHLTVPVKVVGVEPRKDIAVLKVNSPKALDLLKNFTPLDIANMDELLVGQKTIAIGNPFGLDHSLTTGVISALGREVPGIGGVTIRNMIQTDASINPGNSGGPLLDSQGKLIGLNTMIYSQSGASAGVGFVVPADDVSRIVNQIIKHGRVVLAGIGIQFIEKNVAARLGVHQGVLIGRVLPKTPAAHAGLVGTSRNNWGNIILGDVIIGFNGYPVRNYDNLYNYLSDTPVGSDVTLTVLRDGKKRHFTIKTIDIAAY